MPKFSIIVPIYKVEKYIKQCIRSILDQTYTDFEVICVDDCGMDNSIKIVKKMAERDDRIIILQHDHNRGLSAARNTGLEVAKGEYTLFVDSDDWLEKDSLEVLCKTFDEVKTNSIIFDGYNYSDSKHTRSTEPLLNCKTGYYEFTPDTLPLGSDYAWIKAYKTSAIKNKNLTFPEGLTFEDGEFYFKFFGIYPKTYMISNCLYNYRERSGSIVTNARKGIVNLEHFYQILRNIRQFYIDNDLYEKYKLSICMILNIRIDSCRRINKNYEKSIRLSSQILQEFGGLEEFEEFSEESNPMVSVIVPIRNDKFENCIKYIQNQNYINLEILCVTDNNYTKLNELKNLDNRIKIINCSKGNIGSFYNKGIKMATGKYLLFADASCEYLQNSINDCVEVIKQTHHNFIIFKTSCINKEQSENNVFINDYKSEAFEEGYTTIDDEFLKTLPIKVTDKFFKRDFIIRQNIFFDESLSFLLSVAKFLINIYTKTSETYLIAKIYCHESSFINEFDALTTYNSQVLISFIKNMIEFFQQNNILKDYSKVFFAIVLQILGQAYKNSQDKLIYKNILEECIKSLKVIK